MSGKELLRKLGEETMYSAKGHFKACDIRRNLITFTIWGCALLNIAALFDMNSMLAKILAAVGLLGTIALLIWDAGEGKQYKAKHKAVGEEYLSLHKKVRAAFFLNENDDAAVKSLSEMVQQLDGSEKPDIPWIARKWAQKAIQKYDETDNWWLTSKPQNKT